MSFIPTPAEIISSIERGLVSSQVHPQFPHVRIFNYTNACQFQQAWDDVTRACRGLIWDMEAGVPLSNPMPKFFNYQEHQQKGWAIPSEVPTITEKYDGSLGILYWVNGEPWIATRGSFDSDQARWATDWIRQHDVPLPNDGASHFFEIIYAQNRVVVAYDFEGLVYLGSRDIATGAPVDRSDLFAGTPIRVARTIPQNDLDTLAALDQEDGEGFVAFFPKANVRVKIKFPTYVRLHKVLTGLSDIGIWESLRDGKPIDLTDVPDEFFNFVRSVQGDLTQKFSALKVRTELATSYALTLPDRKAQAQWIMANTRDISGAVFRSLDERDYSDILWKMVRPTSGGRTFSNNLSDAM